MSNLVFERYIRNISVIDIFNLNKEYYVVYKSSDKNHNDYAEATKIKAGLAKYEEIFFNKIKTMNSETFKTILSELKNNQ